MQYLRCGKVSIPLAFVQSLSWARTAKTSASQAGYITAKGFENVEISVKCEFSYGACQAMGLDAVEQYRNFDMLSTDRMDEPDVLTVGGFPIVPSLNFALTSVNLTRIYDPAFNATIGCDLVFSGVRCSKEVTRNPVLDLEDTYVEMPTVVLLSEGKELDVRQKYSIETFTRNPDAIEISIAVGDDLTLVSRDDFLEDFVKSQGKVRVTYGAETVTYHVIAATLSETKLNFVASILPPASQKCFRHTWRNTKLSTIIGDLCLSMGVKKKLHITDFDVIYYMTSDTPMTALRRLQDSVGFIMSWDGNTLTLADPPKDVYGDVILEGFTPLQDTKDAPVLGCIWTDGLYRHVSGEEGADTVRVYSSVSTKNPVVADVRLSYENFIRRRAIIEAPIYPQILHYSCVRVLSQDSLLDGVVENFEYDYVDGIARYEVCLC